MQGVDGDTSSVLAGINIVNGDTSSVLAGINIVINTMDGL